MNHSVQARDSDARHTIYPLGSGTLTNSSGLCPAFLEGRADEQPGRGFYPSQTAALAYKKHGKKPRKLENSNFQGLPKTTASSILPLTQLQEVRLRPTLRRPSPLPSLGRRLFHRGNIPHREVRCDTESGLRERRVAPHRRRFECRHRQSKRPPDSRGTDCASYSHSPSRHPCTGRHPVVQGRYLQRCPRLGCQIHPESQGRSFVRRYICCSKKSANDHSRDAQ